MPKDKKLNLDIGFGGFTEGDPVRGTTIGIDLDIEGEPQSKSEERIDVVRGDGYNLPFATGSLDRTTSMFPQGIMALPYTYGRQYEKDEDFDLEEHWQALTESFRVLKPGGTTRHVWDNEMPASSPREVRRDPYYLALIQLLKNHDMENVKIKIEDNGLQSYEDGIPQYHYAFILTARKKL